MKRAPPAIVLIAGLALTGCSGADSQKDQDEQAGNASRTAAEKAPPVQQLDKGQLKQIIESTVAGADGIVGLRAKIDADEQTVSKTTEAFVDALKNAG